MIEKTSQGKNIFIDAQSVKLFTYMYLQEVHVSERCQQKYQMTLHYIQNEWDSIKL